MPIESGKLDDSKMCMQTVAPNFRGDAFEVSNNTICGPDIDDQPHAHPNNMRQHFNLSLSQLALEIVQHGASMAAYNTTMTLLHATQLEWTDFAKPVIFHEALIVLVQLLRDLRFCLLTNDPQQSARMVCHHKIGMSASATPFSLPFPSERLTSIVIFIG